MARHRVPGASRPVAPLLAVAFLRVRRCCGLVLPEYPRVVRTVRASCAVVPLHHASGRVQGAAQGMQELQFAHAAARLADILELDALAGRLPARRGAGHRLEDQHGGMVDQFQGLRGPHLHGRVQPHQAAQGGRRQPQRLEAGSLSAQGWRPQPLPELALAGRSRHPGLVGQLLQGGPAVRGGAAAPVLPPVLLGLGLLALDALGARRAPRLRRSARRGALAGLRSCGAHARHFAANLVGGPLRGRGCEPRVLEQKRLGQGRPAAPLCELVVCEELLQAAGRERPVVLQLRALERRT
mmetsp:Transcript_18105/g.56746  ORF Transcript_18105/g.56746 Transcript_18105/m.56746 type:complete len:297 (+) Transcript_18105:423-1313(+)